MTRPNVLLICVDHWPGPLMGAAGHERILTPTLNQIAANGVLYTQAYTATPTCIPARRALMTGTTARAHGDRVFDEHMEMDPDLPTMPRSSTRRDTRPSPWASSTSIRSATASASTW